MPELTGCEIKLNASKKHGRQVIEHYEQVKVKSRSDDSFQTDYFSAGSESKEEIQAIG